jgi:hypothetical protein
MTLAATLSKLLAAMRASVTTARRDSERRDSVALPAPLIVALEPRIVYDASAASIGAAAVAQQHAGADVHVTSGARDAALAAADAQGPSLARSAGTAAGASSGSAGTLAANVASGQGVVDATPRQGYMLAPSSAAGDSSTMRAVHGFTDLTARTTDQQVVFVNSNVTDYQTLVAGLPQGTQVVILDSTKDGLAQIEQYLQQHQGVSAIHLVSHGATGEFQVGSTWINEADFSTYSAEFAQIGSAMKAGGDFLIYGCDVAGNADGKALVQQISSISGLNVAASTDATGATTLGGDWVLEYDAGAVHTGVIFSAASEQSYDHVLSAFDETYDGAVGFDTGSTPVASTTLDGLTYTGDQAVEYQVVSGSLPSSGSGGELVANTQGTLMSTLTIQRQDGTLMAIENFDIDIFVSNQVTVQGLDGSGNVVGSIVLDITAGATAYTPGHVTNSSLFHVDLSSNTAFSQVKSIKLIETSGNGTYLSPTLDNFTYLAPSSPPTLTASGGTTSFVSGDNTASTPVVVDSGITLTDGNSTTAVSATVSITGNLHSSEDRLAFTNTSASTYGNISASYNTGSGVLTLTSSGGTATIAQWQAALRAVTYTDTAVTPSSATRGISFTITSDGFTAGNTTSKAVSITDTDQTPIVTATGGTTSYVGASSAVTIDSGISVSDADNTTQSSGTVSVSGGFHSGDTLSFTNDGSTMGNISASYNAATGVLTLTSSGATATDAQWASALKTVKFSSTSTTYANRTISFATSDGTKTSAAATDTINMTAPPVITTDSGSASFVAGDNATSTPVAIDSGLTLTDGSATTLASTTVAITGNFHSGEDVLSFTNDGSTMGNITASYNAATGVMTLTSAGSTATLAQWQSALQSIKYTDTAVTPNNATRTISFTSVDGTGNTSNTATRTVTVTDTDQTPIVSTTGSTTNYSEGAAAITIDSGVSVSDLDNTTQSSGTVSISGGFHSGDTLSFTNDGSTMGNITASYNAATGVLTLTSAGATATDAQWASALKTVKFSSTSTTFGARTISFATSDGTKTSTAATDTVNVVNPLQLTVDSGSVAFVAGDNAPSTPVAVDPGLTVSDTATGTLSSATITISSNFTSGEDFLQFTNDGSTMGNITAGSFNQITGTLTLTSAGSTATLAQWQSALDSIKYTDVAVTPNALTRTVSFSAVDSVGNASGTVSRNVTVADTDQTPIVTATGGTTSYVGATSAVTIDTGVSVSDLDNTTQSSGTVSVSGGFHSGDTLSFTNDGSTMGNISASYNAATGVLTLTSAGATADTTQWANALKAVKFSSTSTTYGNRTISFATSDGTKTSTASTDTVNMTAPPTLTTDSGSAAFVSGDNTASTPVAIDSGLTVTDGSATTLASTTVAVAGGFHSGEDVLAFTNDGSTMGNITASYNATTGVMTLSSAGSTATLAQWQSALRSVTYTDTLVTPNSATRTISFTAVDGAGNTSATATRTVTVTDTDQTPIVTTTGGTTSYVGAASSVTIDTGITVSDLDNTTQSSGTVSVSGGFHSGDTLSFTNDGSTMGNISASYNAATGVLSLTSAGATATDAQWAAALKAVTFSSTSTTYGNRTISFATSDGTKTSTAATDTVNITAPPVVTTDSGSASFVAGDNAVSTPVAIDSGLTVTDGSATTLASTTVAITGNFHSGEDVLSFTNDGSTMGNVTASYNAATGVMMLTSAGSTATLAQWQSALQSIKYTDTAVTPNSATRTISFTALDGAGNTSATATRTVTVTDTDQTPIVTTTGGTTNYVGGAAAATIDSGITVSDLDNTTQSSGTVSVTGGFHSGDTLTFVNTSAPTFGNIVGSYNAATGVLTLTSSGATATDAQWAHALSAVTFSASSSATPGNRTISFATSDGTKTSAVVTDTVAVLGPPTIVTDSGSASFVAGDNTVSTPVAIDSGLTVTDGAASTLATATVVITGNLHTGEDILGFTNTSSATYGNIAASYNAATGVLTLSSSGNSATLAQWQAALDAVTYTNTAVTPNAATRTISFAVLDSGAFASNTATRTVTVADTDQTPIVTTTGGTTNYVAGTSAATIDGGISVSDLDTATQSSGTVSIGTGFNVGDTLMFVNTDTATFGNIVGSYNAGTGVLTLGSSGATATDAQWSHALSAVTFSASASATPGNRTISFATSDGTKTSTAATDTVDLLGPPQITTDAGSASFVAGDNTVSTPVAIDPGLALTDSGSPTLASATVAVTGNFHSGEDVLAFSNTSAVSFGNIASSYNAATGVLTLTSAGNTATLAQWQAALAAVTYTDTAITPNSATRTISFAAVDTGAVTSNTATRTVTVADTDQTPIVTTTGGTATYVTGRTAATIDSGISVNDRDNGTQASATVSITGNFHSGEDVLAFTNGNVAAFGNIGGFYNSTTGVLTLSSAGNSATDAQWASALSAVTFSSSGTHFGNRTISFATSDGTKTSASANATVTMLDTPHVGTDAGSAAFVAGDNTTSTAIVVSPHLTLTDATSTTLASATVSIAGGFHAGEDTLAFKNDGATMGNIAGSYDAATGVLTLAPTSGTATFAQWQAALASITYTDTAVTPNSATRTISFTVTDGNGVASDVQARNVTVTDTDQTPLLTVGGNVTFIAAGNGSTPVAVAPQVTLSDRDNTTELAAQVSITGGFDPAHDTLAFAGSAGTGNIAASYNAATGVLTLTSAGGTATLAQWQAALQSVTFADSSLAAGTGRTITFAISDGAKTSAVASNLVNITNAPAFPPILPATPPTSIDSPTESHSSSFTGDDNTSPADVLEEFIAPLPIGSVPVVSTITFTDPSAPANAYSLDRTSVSRVDMTVFNDASSTLTIDAPLELPDVSFDMAPEDAFSIEVATLLPPSEAMHGGSDVTVRLANGRSLPGWVHYDAAKGVLRGKLPPGVEDVHIVVRTRDASGHVTRREVVLAPHEKHGGSHGASHHVTHPKMPGHAERALAEPTVARAARPVGKPSLDQQFAQARAALHVSHPGDARRRV